MDFSQSEREQLSAVLKRIIDLLSERKWLMLITNVQGLERMLEGTHSKRVWTEVTTGYVRSLKDQSDDYIVETLRTLNTETISDAKPEG